MVTIPFDFFVPSSSSSSTTYGGGDGIGGINSSSKAMDERTNDEMIAMMGVGLCWEMKYISRKRVERASVCEERRVRGVGGWWA